MSTNLHLFLLITLGSALAYSNLNQSNRLNASPVQPHVFEDIINASVDCVRGVLQNGLPDYGMPSFDPLIVDNFTLDLDALNIEGLSGQIDIDNGRCNDIASFVMTQIKGEFILIPPTFTVTFSLNYDQVGCSGNYKFNVTVFGINVFGEGTILNEVGNLDAEGYVKAVVSLTGVEIQEFNAPITLETVNFKITGLMGDEVLSANLSDQLSAGVPEYVNSHPEIFTDIIAPILIDIYNALTNNDVGIGIIKEITQKCIIDIVYPPDSR